MIFIYLTALSILMLVFLKDHKTLETVLCLVTYLIICALDDIKKEIIALKKK